MKTVAEIINELRDNVEGFEDLIRYEKNGIMYEGNLIAAHPNDGPDGIEADGKECGKIFSYQGRYFRVPYYYSSWDSSELYWESATEVKPVERTYINWESI